MSRHHYILGLLALLVQITSSGSCDLPLLSVPLGDCIVPINDGITQANVFSWGMPLLVHGILLCCTPSLFTSTPFFDSREVCSDAHRGEGSLAQCRSKHGNWLTDPGNLFQTFSQLKGQNENIERFNVSVGKETKAPIEFQPGKSITLLSGIIENWENHTAHHFPVGPKSTAIQELKNAGLIASRSWSLDVGTASRKGTIIFDGWQPELAKLPMVEYKTNYTQAVNGRFCELQVGIKQIDITIGGEVIPLMTDSDELACIETSVSFAPYSDGQLTRT